MRVDIKLLNEQITILSNMLEDEIMGYRRGAIEGLLDMLIDIADSETDLLTIELI